ncbi:MAG: carboxypeptidase regulatory-like domain-containing protein [Planctomycetes bacterium]|nr:carboxypeptidase regulatory-like domain-containing protein [Planctomycetota bacterium]
MARPVSVPVVLVGLAAALAAVVAWVAWSGDPPSPPAPLAAPGGSATAPAPSGGATRRADGPGPTRTVLDPARDAAAPESSAGPATPVLAGRDGPRLRGRVVDPEGIGVPDARVVELPAASPAPGLRIEGLDGLADRFAAGVRTDADGRFELTLAAPGDVQVVARHADYRKGAWSGRVDGDRDDVEIRLTAGASIGGQVTGIPAGARVPDVACEVLPAGASSLAEAMDAVTGPLRMDLSGLLRGFGSGLGERRVEAADDGTFELRGLEPERAYLVWGVALPDGEAADGLLHARVCTARVSVLAGARGVSLPWSEGLVVRLRAVDADTGAPVEALRVAAGMEHAIEMFGISVPVAIPLPQPGTHWPDGVVEIRNLLVEDERGTAKVELRALGYRTWQSEAIAVPREGRVDVGTVQLTSAPTLRVRVLAAATGAPVAGARLELGAIEPAADAAGGEHRLQVGTSVRSSTTTTTTFPDQVGPAADRTDADGVCELTCELSERARLGVRADGFAPVSLEVGVPARGRADVEVQLVAGGRVAVTVVDGHGEPAAGIRVLHRGSADAPDEPEAEARTQRTDAAGVAIFAHVAPGRHRFRAVEAEDGLPAGLQISIDDTTLAEQEAAGWLPVDVADGATAQLRIALPLRATVRGTITLDGRPLERAVVSIEPGSAAGEPDEAAAAARLARGFVERVLGGDRAEVRTDDLGGYAIERVPVGVHRLVIRHADRAMAEQVPVDVVEGETVRNVDLRDTVLTGRIVGADGAPIRGATVAVARAGGELPASLAEASDLLGAMFGSGGDAEAGGVRTDGEGRFELRGVAAGVALSVRASGRLLVARAVAVPALAAGARRDIGEVALDTAGRLRVTVTTDQGQVVVRATSLEPVAGDAEPAVHTAVLSRGRAWLDGLRPGRWRVTLEGLGDGPEPTREVTVGAGETTHVDW